MCLGEGAFALVMGIICGYPTGAKIVCDLRNRGVCSKEEAERLISFTNNSGPLFIVGTVGISLFGDTRTGILLLVTHILACISVGVCFRFWKARQVSGQQTKLPLHKQVQGNHGSVVRFSNLGEVLASSIMNAIRSVVMIGGFVVLFSVIVSILKQSHVLDLVCFALEPVFRIIWD